MANEWNGSPDDIAGLVAQVNVLSAKLSRVEANAVHLEAQLLFTERALLSCIDRERRLCQDQEELRNELAKKVRGLSTE